MTDTRKALEALDEMEDASAIASQNDDRTLAAWKRYDAAAKRLREMLQPPAEAASPPVAGGELPPLPEPADRFSADANSHLTADLFTAEKMRSYATAARATRPPEAAGEVHADYVDSVALIAEVNNHMGLPTVIEHVKKLRAAANFLRGYAPATQQERGPV